MKRPMHHKKPPVKLYVTRDDYAYWLEQFSSWQADVRETLNYLTLIQQALLEHVEEVETYLEALHEAESDPNRSPEQYDFREDLVRAHFHRARRRQESVLRAMNHLWDEFSAIEPISIPIPRVASRSGIDDRVNEAGWESFPASDPPSSNPG